MKDKLPSTLDLINNNKRLTVILISSIGYFSLRSFDHNQNALELASRHKHGVSN